MTPEEYKQARHALGLSQPEFLDALGISGSSHKKYSGGFRPVPDTVALLIQALKKIQALESERETRELELDK